MLEPVTSTAAAIAMASADPWAAQETAGQPPASPQGAAGFFRGDAADLRRRFDDIFGAPDHRLYDTQGPTDRSPVTQTPAPAVPGKPLDMQSMERMNRAAQDFFKQGTFPAKGYDDLRQDLVDAQAHFKAATDALKAGDYRKAEGELHALGFPLPAPGTGLGMLKHELKVTTILLGQPVKFGKNDSWTPQGDVQWGKGGNQDLNDLQGFTLNAALVNRLSALPGGVSNPPAEAQLMRYMRELAHPANGGKAPSAKDVMDSASQITSGMIVHYSAVARTGDPVYDANPGTRWYFKDDAGQFHEFATQQDARKAAAGQRVEIRPLPTHSPDAWSDIASPGMHAGRYIGDCESKVYLQTRLLTEAGFTSLGSVDVQNESVGHGHMFGIFKAPDGTIWVTSNEDFRQVKPGDQKAGVTQADLDRTLKDMTAEVFHVEPNFKGETDLSDFKFATAATANLSGSNAAVESIRRSTELNQMGRTEVVIPPAAAKP